MKRLVVCCDGTWNRPDHIDRGVAAPTNVAKLALARRRPRRGRRRPGACTTRRRRHAPLASGCSAAAFGDGLSRNVRDALPLPRRRLRARRPAVLFGFSRGAYTARSVAGMIRNAGILRREERGRIDEAYALYRDPHRDSEPSGIAAQLFRRTYAHATTPIELHRRLGHRRRARASRSTASAAAADPDVELPRHGLSRIVRNALPRARDRRAPRAVQADAVGRGEAAAATVLEQVWFAGVHCDVGGGYRDPALSEIPLLWMAERARGCGLALEADHLVAAAPGFDPAARRAGR